MKKWLIIITAVILVLVIAVIGGMRIQDYLAAQGDFTPLTSEQKEEILEAYRNYLYFEDNVSMRWVEDNGGESLRNYFRYFGTYGDCIVMLKYGDNLNAIGYPISLPCHIPNLAYFFDYPVECSVYLYNTNPNYPKASDPLYTNMPPITGLEELAWLGVEWLTEDQLLQLTKDLEHWVAEGNY